LYKNTPEESKFNSSLSELRNINYQRRNPLTSMDVKSSSKCTENLTYTPSPNVLRAIPPRAVRHIDLELSFDVQNISDEYVIFYYLDKLHKNLLPALFEKFVSITEQFAVLAFAVLRITHFAAVLKLVYTRITCILG
jgi:hypothetical protein